jgi:predicted Zn finger-like uncharacterized protein
MILSCPSCQTRFQVDDNAVNGAAGRVLRCANCGHTWHFALALVEPETAQPSPAAAREREPPLLPEGPARPPRAEAAAAQQRRSGAGFGWLALILIVAAAALVGYLARDTIMAHWPPAARVYALLGLASASPNAGLEIKVMPATRTADGGLLVNGDISNTAGIVKTLPRLRVALRDNAKNELEYKLIPPPVERLRPGETAHFSTAFEHPNSAATGVAVTLAPD